MIAKLHFAPLPNTGNRYQRPPWYCSVNVLHCRSGQPVLLDGWTNPARWIQRTALTLACDTYRSRV